MFLVPLVIMLLSYLKVYCVLKNRLNLTGESNSRHSSGFRTDTSATKNELSGKMFKKSSYDVPIITSNGMDTCNNGANSNCTILNAATASNTKANRSINALPIVLLNEDNYKQNDLITTVFTDYGSDDSVIGGPTVVYTIGSNVPVDRALDYQVSVSSTFVPASSRHKKAFTTSLIIVGTYLMGWMPAMTYFAVSCVDGCPFPILHQSLFTRAIAAIVTTNLIILKAIIDPFIYLFRMKEVKLATKQIFCR